MTTSLCQKITNEYLAQVYASQPAPEKLILISSHDQEIPATNRFCFPRPDISPNPDTTHYFIRGLTISPGKYNLAKEPQPDIHIELICGKQTWVKGQLGQLDQQTIKNLLIPIPAQETGQEIELIITCPENNMSGKLEYNIVLATDIRGDGIPITMQIIYDISPDMMTCSKQINSVIETNVVRMKSGYIGLAY
jgi:hypothetical protein